MAEDRMRVAIITPYYREPLEVLRQCHESVLRQTYPCTHFMVADGCPNLEVSQWSIEHIVLSKPHGDVGDTPRGIGSLSAASQGYDAVAYLDADNWYYPDHVECMVALHRQSGAAVCTASRSIHRLDGSLMYADRHECDGRTHVDTNCYFITRAAFGVLPVWVLMPKQLAAVGDRVFWHSVLSRGLTCSHHFRPTVAYRTQWQVHYHAVREPAPPGTKTNDENTGAAIRWWMSLPAQERDELQKRLGFRYAGPSIR